MCLRVLIRYSSSCLYYELSLSVCYGYIFTVSSSFYSSESVVSALFILVHQCLLVLPPPTGHRLLIHSCNKSSFYRCVFFKYLYTLAVSRSLGGSRQHKRTTKTMGTSLRSSSNDEGSSRVWMALLEQHSPSFPISHKLRRFIDAISPYCPYHRVASIRQPRGNSGCQSELRHNHSPLIPIPSTLTCLPYIHPPIIQGSL